jgi:hypothetical protein
MELVVFGFVALAIIGLAKLGTSRESYLRLLILAIALLAAPVAVDIVAKAQGSASAAGINLLLYWPVDFAYIALAIACFAVVGWRSVGQTQGRAAIGAALGATLGLGWATFAFLVVTQVHVWGGGRL